MTPARGALLALVLAAAPPAAALDPLPVGCAVEGVPAVRGARGGFDPTWGLRTACFAGPLLVTSGLAVSSHKTKPVDPINAFLGGLGLRLAPTAWWSVDASFLLGDLYARTADVNYLGWYGPEPTWPARAVRLHTAVGPALGVGRAVFRPFVSAAYTRLWAKEGGDRFRTWGGNARWVELGIGLEAVLPQKLWLGGAPPRGAP